MTSAEQSAHQAQLAELDRLRAALSPEGGFKVVDDFARWLVASAALLASIGTAFGASGFGELHGLGKSLFSAAVVMLGISLALAVFSLRPRDFSYNPNDIDSMVQAVSAAIDHRARYVKLAGLGFAGALVLAALAWPLSTERHDPAGMSFTLSESGVVAARLSVGDAAPKSPVQAWFAAKRVPRGLFMPRSRTFADEDGRASVTLEIGGTAGLQTLTLVGKWRRKGAKATTSERLRIAIPHRNVGQAAAGAVTGSR